MQNNDLLKKLITKTIAIGSGKGGVGKSTTALNLALYFVKKKMRVGLFDLDPLSDLLTILGLEEPENALTKNYDARLNNFSNHIFKVFENLEIVFPYLKLKKQDGLSILEKLYQQYLPELERRYDLLLFDLPAGVRYEDNLIYLKYINILLLVTNAEPQAHVSAGGYIKSVLETNSDVKIFIWHNKYERIPGQAFDPQDIIGNYNKNVSNYEKLAESIKEKIENLAFIPQDPALDLLLSNSTPKLNLLRSILDLACFMQEKRIEDLANNLNFSPRLFVLIKYFILHTQKINSVSEYLDQFGEYLKKILLTDLIFKEDLVKKNQLQKIKNQKGKELFKIEEKKLLENYLTRIKVDAVLLNLNRLIIICEQAFSVWSKANSPFAVKISGLDYNRGIDASLGRVLDVLNIRYPDLSPELKNAAGLMVFYFSVYKLFQLPSVLKLLVDFIPKRKNRQGRIIRDKYKQIVHLITQTKDYSTKYFNLVKTLYPLIHRQLVIILETFLLKNLVLRDKNGNLHKSAYLNLFINLLHEILNSGLAVIVGFKHRPAARAFQQAAERLIHKIKLN